MANSSMFSLPSITVCWPCELLHHRGVIGGNEVLQHLGGAGGGDSLGADIVLDAARECPPVGKLLAPGRGVSSTAVRLSQRQLSGLRSDRRRHRHSFCPMADRYASAASRAEKLLLLQAPLPAVAVTVQFCDRSCLSLLTQPPGDIDIAVPRLGRVLQQQLPGSADGRTTSSRNTFSRGTTMCAMVFHALGVHLRTADRQRQSPPPAPFRMRSCSPRRGTSAWTARPRAATSMLRRCFFALWLAPPAVSGRVVPAPMPSTSSCSCVHGVGRVGQGAGGVLELRESDDIPQRGRAQQLHHQPVQAEGKPAVGRRAIAESVDHEAKPLLDRPPARSPGPQTSVSAHPADGYEWSRCPAQCR